MNDRVVAEMARATVVFSVMAACSGSATETYLRESGRVQDLETSASGYIYRTDGENPPVFIKLGEGKNEKFDAILENFKKENGFRGMPVGGVEPPSPFNMPVVGQDQVHYSGVRSSGGHNSGSRSGGYRPNADFGDFDDGKYGLEDMDDLAPITDVDYHHNFDDNDDDHYNIGGFNFGPSPFKYHHDVSAEGLKGDAFSLDDQNYFGSPYTHNEYKSPGKHHSKSGGAYQKAGHYFAHGSTGDSGYKNQHEFDKGHAGKYGKEDLKGHYKKASGHGAGHVSEADHYGKHRGSGHGNKGQKYGETESRKKGHKTTGYHNVYHKDEYNKEQMFYEDAHKHGKHDKYGGKHGDFAHKDGGRVRGHHRDSGYDEAHKGATGQHAEGGHYDEHKGHGVESGHKSHRDHKAEYDTLSDNKKYGEHETGGVSGGGDDFY